jgi:hypothetical protein
MSNFLTLSVVLASRLVVLVLVVFYLKEISEVYLAVDRSHVFDTVLSTSGEIQEPRHDMHELACALECALECDRDSFMMSGGALL